MPLISVIVPVYKVEKYLKECLDSILSQDFTDFELLIVDDGSPDNCPAICDEYEKTDSRIRVVHRENGGLSAARNSALDICSGQYVTFVDSDDYIAPGALGNLYDSLVRFDADMSVGNMNSFDENSAEKPFYIPSESITVLENEDILKTMNQPCACDKLYKASLFEGVRFPEGRLYEDVFIYHKILDKVSRIVLTGKTVYFYRIRSDSIMHKGYDPKFTDIIFAVKERCEWLESKGYDSYADETRLFLYSRVAVAVVKLDPSDQEQKKLLDEVTGIYRDNYGKLMSSPSTGIKQKIRFMMLRYCPKLHSFIFGRKMPEALG